MWRDPLDELIDALERTIPVNAPKVRSPVDEFMQMSEVLDRQPARVPPTTGPEPRIEGTPPSRISSATTTLGPARPARRLDPSAPTWDYAGQADADDTEG